MESRHFSFKLYHQPGLENPVMLYTCRYQKKTFLALYLKVISQTRNNRETKYKLIRLKSKLTSFQTKNSMAISESTFASVSKYM